MLAHPLAVGEIEHQGTAGAQYARDVLEHLQIILGAFEIAERVSHQYDAVEAVLREADFPRIALVEADGKIHLFCPSSGHADQVSRAIHTSDFLKAASGQLERVPPLATAEIQDAIARLNTGRGYQ